MRKPQRLARRNAQTGAVLFVALILLVVLSLLAVAAARMQTVEERMARNENNRQIGAGAAEATLRYVEANLQRGTYQNFGTSPGLYNLESEISDLQRQRPADAQLVQPGADSDLRGPPVERRAHRSGAQVHHREPAAGGEQGEPVERQQGAPRVSA